jgi:hypothetical protein
VCGCVGVDLAAVAVTVGALAVLAGSAGPQSAIDLSAAARWSLALSLLPVLLAGWLAGRAGSAGAVSAVAGLAFGGMALCTRAVTVPAGLSSDLPGGLMAIGTDPLAWSLVGFGVAALLLYAFALEHGEVGPVTALLWIVEVVVPAAVGGLLLGDTARAGWLPAAGVAMLAAVGAAAVLAGAPAQSAVAGASAAAHSQPPK